MFPVKFVYEVNRANSEEEARNLNDFSGDITDVELRVMRSAVFCNGGSGGMAKLMDPELAVPMKRGQDNYDRWELIQHLEKGEYWYLFCVKTRDGNAATQWSWQFARHQQQLRISDGQTVNWLQTHPPAQVTFSEADLMAATLPGPEELTEAEGPSWSLDRDHDSA